MEVDRPGENFLVFFRTGDYFLGKNWTGDKKFARIDARPFIVYFLERNLLNMFTLCFPTSKLTTKQNFSEGLCHKEKIKLIFFPKSLTP